VSKMQSGWRRWAVRPAFWISAAGAALLAAALWHAGGSSPGWEPVNKPLRATLDALEAGAKTESTHAAAPVSAAASAAPAPASTAAPTPKMPPSPAVNARSAELIDLNSADAALLDPLPGIGPSKAQAIADYRAKHGPFRKPEDLLNVKGIGPKLLADIRQRVKI
jgi:competence protein ComEA